MGYTYFLESLVDGNIVFSIYILLRIFSAYKPSSFSFRFREKFLKHHICYML